MAMKTYQEGARQAFLGNIDLSTDNIRAIAIDTADYTFSQSHQNLDDVAGAARVATSGNLAGVSISTASVVDCDDFSFSSVSGDTFEAIIFYKHTGTESTSTLLFYIDQDSGASPISVTPNGNNISVTINASGIAKIAAD